MKFLSFANPFLLVSFLFLFLLGCSQYESQEQEFNYDEATRKGPSRWGRLKPEWRNCIRGQRQSPIDIRTVQVSSQVRDLRRKYRFGQAVLRNRTQDVAVIWSGNAGSITINGTVYRVINCHWHSPSEHTINGIRFPLEIHIVHQSDQNRIAVVGILYRYGLPDLFISSLLLPIATLRQRDMKLGFINPRLIGYRGSSFYQYNGSLTTPPCSEGVIWTVFQQTRTVSRLEVRALRAVLPPQNKNNSRPIQRLNRRRVLLRPGRNIFP